MTEEAVAAPKRGRGRPRKTEVRAPHQPTHKPERSGAVVRGRNGEILTRNRPVASSDQFEFPKNLKEPGWDYQWIPYAVIGNTNTVRIMNSQMKENAWRECHSSRIAAHYGLPSGQAIIIDDQILHERPMELSIEARKDEERAARRLISDRNESLKLTNTAMPSGFEVNRNKYHGTGGDVRIHMDASLEVDRPSHTLAEPGE